MTAKKAHTETMILLVVPLGFCTGTELLNTRPHSNQIALPMVKEGPPGSRMTKKQVMKTLGQAVYVSLYSCNLTSELTSPSVPTSVINTCSNTYMCAAALKYSITLRSEKQRRHPHILCLKDFLRNFGYLSRERCFG